MDLTLNDEQRMIQAVAREFAEKEVRPIAEAIDREARFPRDTVRRMGELGLMGIFIPEECGGSGGDTVAYSLAVEELARVCASHAVIMSVNNSLYCEPVYKFGTPEQKQRFLAPYAAGQKLGCFSLTEPEAGSDATNQNVLARREGDHYVIDGRKIFVTNGREADAALVFAQTDRSKKSHGISAFLIEKGTPGFNVVKTEEKLGIRASDTAEFLFEGCRVPAANRLGAEGEGFKVAMTAIDGGRIGIAAQALGIAVGAHEASLTYARERKSFGKPIIDHQAINFRLADMATEIEVARQMVWHAAALRDAGRPCLKEASMAKLFASEAAMKAATKAVQIHGGAGYITEFPVERIFRDAKLTEIGEGTSEIQRLVIAREILQLT